VLVPYADFNLLKFPDKDRAMEKITDLTMLSDILPTGFHGATTAGVTVGSTVYIAGAGPVGLAAAASAQILGAAVIIVGDRNAERLAHARKVGFETVDISKHDNLGEQIAEILGEPVVDASVDAVGFEASGHGSKAEAAPAAVLNDLMDITFVAGGLGIPGLYVVEDPGAPNEDAKKGMLKVRIGKGWAKSLHFHTGQAPVLQYNRQLMQAILHDRIPIAKIVNATVIPLDQAPQGYQDFDKGAAKKFVLNPNGLIGKAA
jgi:glutathione-independent formaldehyde dehydrogenase